MPRFPLALGFALAAAVAAAQAPAAKPDKPAAPLKKSPLDKIDGYKRHVIEGFTVLVSNDVLTADTDKYERKPLEVLELELETVVKVLPPRTVELFRKLILWAEWDETEVAPNGRATNAVAIYYGGHQLSLFTEGKHPLKSRTVTILSMKSLTEEHQPKTDSGRCVLLHELAHAVHDQLLGRDHPGIKAAFAQAMQRKLYDRDGYLTTNEAEFFAELTNAYFDQNSYFPRTRDELKAHDPASFQVLDGVWGTGKRAALAPKAAPKKDPAPEAGPAVADLRFGEVAHGPDVSPDSFDKKPVLVAAWGKGDGPILAKLAQAAAELGPYGARVVAARPPGEDGATEKAVEEMKARKAEFTVVAAAGVKPKEGDTPVPLRPGEALVFGIDGKCEYRGPAGSGPAKLRAAVGKKLVADLGKPAVSEKFRPAAAALASGDPLTAAIPKLSALVGSSDADTAAEAKAVLAAVLAPGKEAIDEAQRSAKAEPLAAFLTAERLAAAWKGTAVGTKAAALAQTLQSNPTVAKELRARKALQKVQDMDKLLLGQPGSYDPLMSEFQTKYEVPIKQLQAMVDQMRKQHPNTEATAEAERIGKSYGGN